MKTIIVTGANGNLGMAVTNELLDKGYRVIATVANETGRKDFGANDHLDVQAVNLTNEEETSVFVAANIGRYQKLTLQFCWSAVLQTVILIRQQEKRSESRSH